jgi:hypothetical protein
MFDSFFFFRSVACRRCGINSGGEQLWSPLIASGKQPRPNLGCLTSTQGLGHSGLIERRCARVWGEAVGAEFRPTALIAIHGVGATTAGTMLRELCGELAGPTSTAEIGGCPYQKIRPLGEQRYERAYEVYWANLKPGGDTRLARVLRPFHVLLALSQIGGTGWDGRNLGINAPSTFGKALHAYLWSVAITLPAIYFSLLHLPVLPEPWNIILACSSIVMTYSLGFVLRNLDVWARISMWLTPFAGGATILVWIQHRMTSSESDQIAASAQIAASLISLTYFLVIALSFFAVVELVVKTRRAHPTPPRICFLVRFAALTLPFTILGGAFGALSWALNLSVGAWLAPDKLNEWGGAYIKALPFDLALLEFAFAGTTFGVGLFLVFVFRRFSRSLPTEARKREPQELGQWIRQKIKTALLLLLAGNTFVSALYIFNIAFFPGEGILQVWPAGWLHDRFIAFGSWLTGQHANGGPVYGATAFAIYAASSTRIVSFIPGLIGPLRTAAAVAADVVLWLAPKEPLSYRRWARERVVKLVEELTPQYDVHVLAYSQGTAVALDALHHVSNFSVKLITAGSPLDSLYHDFLNIRFSRPGAVSSWMNYYRSSDYIGGSIDAADRSTLVRSDYTMSHFNYFHAPELVEEIGATTVFISEPSVVLCIDE